MTPASLRQRAGSIVLDLPRLLPLLSTRRGWIRARNRRQGLREVEGGRGVLAEGEWSNDLHACQTLPLLGRALLSRALAEWPVAFADQPSTPGKPLISVLLPHRGREREPLLRLTIASWLAQRDVPVECVVIEQSAARELGEFPAGVRHLHLPHPTDPEPWRKSWAYNAGAAAASSGVLVCHDSDILVPRDYAAEILRWLAPGRAEVAHLQRFLFCLREPDTASLLRQRRMTSVTPERVRQNWQGGTLAITREAFSSIGGFDERFVGWTGEDREFFDRCRELPRVECGYLPFIHLWHPEQSSKSGAARDSNLRHFRDIMDEPRVDRIRRLRTHA